MPISGEQFKAGLDDTSTKVWEFLKKNKGSAYDIAEIRAGIGWSSRTFWEGFAYVWVLQSCLKELVNKGLVETKTIQGKDYYMVK